MVYKLIRNKQTHKTPSDYPDKYNTEHILLSWCSILGEKGWSILHLLQGFPPVIPAKKLKFYLWLFFLLFFQDEIARL